MSNVFDRGVISGAADWLGTRDSLAPVSQPAFGAPNMLCLCVESNFASAMVRICCARAVILRASFGLESLQPVQ